VIAARGAAGVERKCDGLEIRQFGNAPVHAQSGERLVEGVGRLQAALDEAEAPFLPLDRPAAESALQEPLVRARPG
jgi:hypothetical protein